MSREVMQQALEALEVIQFRLRPEHPIHLIRERLAGKSDEAIAALRAALAEPEMEPVAWQCREHGDTEWVECSADAYGVNPRRYAYRALYTALTPRKPERDAKLWLWKNFVDGRPEYWAFDNAFPVHLDNGDPQTLGEPCGYALFKPSRKGRDASDEEVLSRIRTTAPTPRKPLHESDVNAHFMNLAADGRAAQFGPQQWFQAGFATAEAAHGIKEQEHE